MYTFIDADKRTVNIETEEEAENALKLANDFRNFRIYKNEHYEFHRKRRMYWEDFYTQLKKLKN